MLSIFVIMQLKIEAPTQLTSLHCIQKLFSMWKHFDDPSSPNFCCKCNKKAVLSQRWPRDARYISGSNEPLRRYGHSKLSKMAACRQLGFDVTRNSAIWSADSENPTLEPKMKFIGSPVAEIWPFAYLGAYGTPFWGEGKVVLGQRWHHSKERC